jgi:hypothetical protein
MAPFSPSLLPIRPGSSRCRSQRQWQPRKKGRGKPMWIVQSLLIFKKTIKSNLIMFVLTIFTLIVFNNFFGGIEITFAKMSSLLKNIIYLSSRVNEWRSLNRIVNFQHLKIWLSGTINFSLCSNSLLWNKQKANVWMRWNMLKTLKFLIQLKSWFI